MATTEVDPVKNEQAEAKAAKTKSHVETTNVSDGVDIKKLLEAGAHFGHKTSRWHPGMGQYIHSKRGGIHIIDLAKTVSTLETALNFLSGLASEHKQVLFVGTKRQARELVKKTAQETNMPYVTERWLGGLMTNQKTMNARIKYLKDQETKMASGALASKYNKLELQRFQEEIDRLNYFYGGVKELVPRPGAMFVIDVGHEINAIREARKLNVPIVAVVDTNADPRLVDYPIPANDDASKTIQLILDYVQQALVAGKAKSKTVSKDKDEDETTAKVAKKPVKTETKEE